MTDPFTLITSATNNRIKDLVRLRQRRFRNQRRLMIIEEPLVIRRALDAGVDFREVYFCPDHLEAGEQHLLNELMADGGITAFQLTPLVMAKVAYRDHPQGLLAVAAQKSLQLDEIRLPNQEPALIVILEGVEKPGNLGAIQRVADGAGAHAVILCGAGVDPWNPNVLRASRGACFALPTVQAETALILGWLKKHGFATVAANPEAASSFNHVDLTGPVAIFLGTEHDGLSAGLLAEADRIVAIPMHGVGDSLNVSTSAAVLLYEAVRQRSSVREAP